MTLWDVIKITSPRQQMNRKKKNHLKRHISNAILAKSSFFPAFVFAIANFSILSLFIFNHSVPFSQFQTHSRAHTRLDDIIIDILTSKWKMTWKKDAFLAFDCVLHWNELLLNVNRCYEWYFPLRFFFFC